MWDSIKSFDSFFIVVAPRYENYDVDTLVVVETSLYPFDEMLNIFCKMEVVFKHVVPNNFDN